MLYNRLYLNSQDAAFFFSGALDDELLYNVWKLKIKYIKMEFFVCLYIKYFNVLKHKTEAVVYRPYTKVNAYTKENLLRKKGKSRAFLDFFLKA